MKPFLLITIKDARAPFVRPGHFSNLCSQQRQIVFYEIGQCLTIRIITAVMDEKKCLSPFHLFLLYPKL